MLRTFTKIGMAVNKLQNEAHAVLLPNEDINSKSALASIIDRCRRLDDELLAWHKKIPSNWSYSSAPMRWTRASEDNPETWQHWTGSIHRYPNVFVARNWDYYRAYRITIHAVMIRCADTASVRAGLDTSMRTLAAESRALVQVLIDEVCASIPFLLGDMPDIICSITAPARGPHPLEEALDFNKDETKPEPPRPRPGMTPCHPPDQFLLKIGEGCALYPLLVAASILFVDPLQHRWIKGRLLEAAKRGQLASKIVTMRLQENIFGFQGPTEGQSEVALRS